MTKAELIDAIVAKLGGSKADAGKALDAVTEAIQEALTKGEEVKLLYASQIGTAPPTFAIVSNRPRDVPESYQRYLANGFREVWPFPGSPLRLKFTSRGAKGSKGARR